MFLAETVARYESLDPPGESRSRRYSLSATKDA